jgi:hypothetical protein
MGAHRIHDLRSRGAPPHTDEEKIRITHGLHEPRKLVLIRRVRLNNGDALRRGLQFFGRKFGQGFPGVIFLLANHDDDVRWFRRLQLQPEDGCDEQQCAKNKG